MRIPMRDDKLRGCCGFTNQSRVYLGRDQPGRKDCPPYEIHGLAYITGATLACSYNDFDDGSLISLRQ